MYCFKDTDNTVMTIDLEEFDEYDGGTVLYTPEKHRQAKEGTPYIGRGNY
ncbi:MAG: hypothetical protein L6V93_05030 [Clostridiales bacterium]|nr:MAG: hypothetical protein L6V93_05030 [Clostridiales bacterium]